MSNKETLQEYNTKLIANNDSLQTVMNMINNLPEAGGDDMIKYSTEEQIIGTWIDDKPVYRKVIYDNELHTIPSGWAYAELKLPSIIPDMDTFISLKGAIELADKSAFIPLNVGMGNTNRATCYVSVPTSGSMIVMSSWNFQKTIIIVEYTKTTD